MHRTACVLALALLTACSSAIVRVETSAPNAVAYLVKGEPDGSGAPTRYLQKVGLPSTMAVQASNLWLYVDAPYHAPRVVRLNRLSKARENQVRVELQATQQQEYLE